MDAIHLNNILERDDIANTLIDNINNIFDCQTMSSPKIDKPGTQPRGIYVYGAPGSGKTEFVIRTIKSAGYDVIKYNVGDIRNKSVIESLTKHHLPDVNIMSLWNYQRKKIVIVMDEIDGMNNGDKGGLTSLIKLIRPKKTKKQLNEMRNYNPIVCISNYHIDKKIGELMKACKVIELTTPTDAQIDYIIKNTIKKPFMNNKLRRKLVENINGDLRRLSLIINAVKKGMYIDQYVMENILTAKSKNDDAKVLARNLFNIPYEISEHNTLICETDRTIVGLLWHENVCDLLSMYKKNKTIPLYNDMLDNICLGDYVDRITFQKQIWQFNELSSLIKTMYGNRVIHNNFPEISQFGYEPEEIRFTRALTKYSSEFNNFSFLQSMCQKLGLERNDLFAFFSNLQEHPDLYNDYDLIDDLSNYDVGKLEVERIFRLLQVKDADVANYICEGATTTTEQIHTNQSKRNINTSNYDDYLYEYEKSTQNSPYTDSD